MPLLGALKPYFSVVYGDAHPKSRKEFGLSSSSSSESSKKKFKHDQHGWGGRASAARAAAHGQAGLVCGDPCRATLNHNGEF